MTAEEKKEIILSLLRDDLVNTKLVDGLCNIDFHAERFYLNISDVIFRLIGIDIDDPENEPIYKEYLDRCSQAIYIQLKDDYNNFDIVTKDLYNFLIAKKRSMY